MNNSVIRKRLKGWLALMMAVTMLLGGSLTVFAGDSKWIKCEYGENPPGIFVNDSFVGGDTICWTSQSTGTGGFKSITILLDGVQKVYSEKEDAEHHDVSSFTLEGDSSTTYRVTNVVYDKNEKKISIEIVSPAYANASNNTSQKAKTSKDRFDSYTDSMDKLMESGKPGETVVLDATDWHSLPITTIRHMQKHSDLSYEIRYDYRGEKFKVIVPIGATFDESIEWYGPHKMVALFGKSMIE